MISSFKTYNQCYVAVLLKIIKNLIKFTLLLAITVGFIFVVKTNFSSYLDRIVKLSIYYETPGLYTFPKVTFCPNFEFNSGKILKMLNNTNDDSMIFEISQSMNSELSSKFNLTGKELIEEAGWNLGEIIEELHYEGIHQQFDRDTTDATLWTREFWIHMSCFTFHPPPTKNRFAKLNIRVRQVKDFCTWYDESGLIYFKSNEECPKYKTVCYKDGDCSLSEILNLSIKVFVQSFIMNTKDFKISSQLDLINSDFASDLTIIKFSGLVDKSNGEDSETCIRKCLFDYIRESYGCNIVSSINLDSEINELCTNFHFETITAVRQVCLRNDCQLPKFGQYWLRSNTFDQNADEDEYKISLIDSEKTQYLKEEESYTIINFLSDFGGNVGFFYGISLLSLFSYIFNLIFSYLNKRLIKNNRISNTIQHFILILRFCVIIIFLWVCILQIITLFQRYLSQNQQLVVSYHVNECVINNDISRCLYEPTYKDWAIGYLTQRGLGCKLPLKTEGTSFLFQCMRQLFFESKPHFTTYVFDEDLPFCNEVNLRKVKYVFEEELSLFLLNYDWKSEFCIDTANDYKNEAGIPHPIIPKIQTRYPKSLFSFLSSLAGIISLYFSITILTLPDFLIKDIFIAYMKKSLAHTYKIVILISKVILIAYTSLVLLVKLDEAFITPAIISSAEPYSFDAQNLVVTACLWDMNVENYKTQLYNLTGSIYPDQKVIKEFFNCKKGTLSFSPKQPFYMRNCIRCTFDSAKVASQLLGITLINKQETDYDVVFFVIHEEKEPPVLDGTFEYLASGNEFTMMLQFFQKFDSNKFKTDETYNQCYLKCLSEALLNRGGISKLYLETSLLFSDIEMDECKNRCKFRVHSLIGSAYTKSARTSKSQVTVAVTIPDKIGQEKNVDIINAVKQPRVLYEKSGFSIMEIINELGTVIGFCFGLSLISVGSSILFVVQFIFQQFFHKFW